MPNEIKQTKTRKKALLTVGWREWLELPELGLPPLKAKIDTGASTSALHAVNVKLIQDEAEPRVRFGVQPVVRGGKRIRLELPLVDMRQVRSSNGRSEERPVVRTTLLLGGRRWPIDITLTGRDSMKFRMLLGREALRKRAVVDVSKSYALGVPELKTAQLLTQQELSEQAGAKQDATPDTAQATDIRGAA